MSEPRTQLPPTTRLDSRALPPPKPRPKPTSAIDHSHHPPHPPRHLGTPGVHYARRKLTKKPRQGSSLDGPNRPAIRRGKSVRHAAINPTDSKSAFSLTVVRTTHGLACGAFVFVQSILQQTNKLNSTTSFFAPSSPVIADLKAPSVNTIPPRFHHDLVASTTPYSLPPLLPPSRRVSGRHMHRCMASLIRCSRSVRVRYTINVSLTLTSTAIRRCPCHGECGLCTITATITATTHHYHHHV